MFLTAICSFAIGAQQISARKEGPSGHIQLSIYKRQMVDLYAAPTLSPSESYGKSVNYDRLGRCSWTVIDGGVGGVPCKIYKCEGTWRYSVPNTAIKDEVQFKATYLIHLDGMPMRSESHFWDASLRTAKTIDVIANYARDHIDVTVNKDGTSEKFSYYPKFGMERFAGMFEPLMRSGLIQGAEMDCAVIHPYTGVPYEFKIKVGARFTGSYFSLPQAGYCLDIEGAEGTSRAYLTRQGQLLKMEMPNKVDAFLESGPLAPERQGWGIFRVSDWDKATEETNPDRPTYHTLVAPVLFKNPNILFPVPCALTE